MPDFSSVQQDFDRAKNFPKQGNLYDVMAWLYQHDKPNVEKWFKPAEKEKPAELVLDELKKDKKYSRFFKHYVQGHFRCFGLLCSHIIKMLPDWGKKHASGVDENNFAVSANPKHLIQGYVDIIELVGDDCLTITYDNGLVIQHIATDDGLRMVYPPFDEFCDKLLEALPESIRHVDGKPKDHISAFLNTDGVKEELKSSVLSLMGKNGLAAGFHIDAGDAAAATIKKNLLVGFYRPRLEAAAIGALVLGSKVVRVGGTPSGIPNDYFDTQRDKLIEDYDAVNQHIERLLQGSDPEEVHTSLLELIRHPSKEFSPDQKGSVTRLEAFSGLKDYIQRFSNHPTLALELANARGDVTAGRPLPTFEKVEINTEQQLVLELKNSKGQRIKAVLDAKENTYTIIARPEMRGLLIAGFVLLALAVVAAVVAAVLMPPVLAAIAPAVGIVAASLPAAVTSGVVAGTVGAAAIGITGSGLAIAGLFSDKQTGLLSAPKNVNAETIDPEAPTN